jgi:hypothetical protein
MQQGTRIEVRTRFDHRWSRGFEIEAILGEEAGAAPQYQVRRRSDGSVLPTLFVDDEVREERRGRSMWWV